MGGKVGSDAGPDIDAAGLRSSRREARSDGNKRMSANKRQQTAAKRQREMAVKERRALKLAKKAARRATPADADPTATPLEETDESSTEPAVASDETPPTDSRDRDGVGAGQT
jgi:hypothetical protein